MNYLIQNTSQAPIMIPVVTMNDGRPVVKSPFILEPNTITKIPAEIYEGTLLKNAFYRSRLEKGDLVCLNSGNAEEAAKNNVAANELAYTRYCDLMTKIESSGALSCEELRPFLDMDGMPKLDLCRKNLGETVVPEIVEQYRSRYLIEKQNGMHKAALVLPTGNQITSGAVDVKIKKNEEFEAEDNDSNADQGVNDDDLSKMSIEQLKIVADELGLDYDEKITFKRLLMRIRKAKEE